MFFENYIGQAYKGVRPFALEADKRKEAKPACYVFIHYVVCIQNVTKIALHTNSFIQRF
jgi:hypothetical protein